MSREQCYSYIDKWLKGKKVDENIFHSAVELLYQLSKSDRQTINGLNQRIKHLEVKLQN